MAGGRRGGALPALQPVPRPPLRGREPRRERLRQGTRLRLRPPRRGLRSRRRRAGAGRVDVRRGGVSVFVLPVYHDPLPVPCALTVYSDSSTCSHHRNSSALSRLNASVVRALAKAAHNNVRVAAVYAAHIARGTVPDPIHDCHSFAKARIRSVRGLCGKTARLLPRAIQVARRRHAVMQSK